MDIKLIQEALEKIKKNMEISFHYCERCGESDPATNDDAYDEICRLIASLDAEKVEYCEWEKETHDVFGFYKTGCKHTYHYPQLNEALSLTCPSCGKPIRIKEPL